MLASTARKIETEIFCAVEGLPWVEGVYALAPTDHPDFIGLAIILAPYEINHLVETHYAVLVATGSYDAARILYVNASMHPPTPMRSARRVVPLPQDRATARRRIADRKAELASKQDADLRGRTIADLALAFQRLAETTAQDQPPASPSNDAPYRGGDPRPLDEYNQAELQALVDRVFRGASISAPLDWGPLELFPDPSPSLPKKHVLVIDDDPETELALDALEEFEVVHTRDGWSAIEQMTTSAFDLVICAVKLDELSGAQIFRMVVKERPELASRFLFLARRSTVASAPPASVAGKVVSRPLGPDVVRAWLSR